VVTAVPALAMGSTSHQTTPIAKQVSAGAHVPQSRGCRAASAGPGGGSTAVESRGALRDLEAPRVMRGNITERTAMKTRIGRRRASDIWVGDVVGKGAATAVPIAAPSQRSMLLDLRGPHG
jgi:hypothetical protein